MARTSVVRPLTFLALLYTALRRTPRFIMLLTPPYSLVVTEPLTKLRTGTYLYETLLLYQIYQTTPYAL
jgi:hypothetical protein